MKNNERGPREESQAYFFMEQLFWYIVEFLLNSPMKEIIFYNKYKELFFFGGEEVQMPREAVHY